MRLTLLMCLAFPAFAEDDGAKVYKKTVPSVVWIHAKHANGTATGSGTLIDAERRLVLTNYHVVEEQNRVGAFFPAFRDGLPIAEKSYYTERAKNLAIGAKVIARDRKADLALIQLDRLPEGKAAVALAALSAEPGQSVHSIGNTGKSGALWGYVPGKVRQVYQKEWKADLGGKVVAFKAKVVETDSATNPGDSGGPLLDDAGKLVGVTQGGALNAQLVSTFVDVSEVKKLLASDDAKAVKGGKPAEPAMTLRDKPTVIVDGAKLYKEETLKKAQAIIDEIHKKKLDVLVETHASAPADDLERIKKLTSPERGEYMQKWARTRMAAEKVEGIGILICSDPRSLFIEFTPAARAHAPGGHEFQNALAKQLLEGMRDKKPDETLLEVLAKIRDGMKP